MSEKDLREAAYVAGYRAGLQEEVDHWNASDEEVRAFARSWAEATPTEPADEVAGLAERVCVLYGWTGVDSLTERGKALTQLWIKWYHAHGPYEPADYPELDDAHIAALAAVRDAIVQRTLAPARSLVRDVVEA